ncbi:Ankyrin-3 [Orbilia brochopaga]|nr:Ankyrin-3 [Drechslerella brochopaga]
MSSYTETTDSTWEDLDPPDENGRETDYRHVRIERSSAKNSFNNSPGPTKTPISYKSAAITPQTLKQVDGGRLYSRGAPAPSTTAQTQNSVWQYGEDRVKAGDLPSCRKLAFEYNFNTPDAQGRTALHIAAYNGDAEIVEWLIENGASPGAKDGDGRTPLFDAIMSPTDPVRIIDLLLEAGTDPCEYDKGGMTALQAALEYSKMNRRMSVISRLAEKDRDTLLWMVSRSHRESLISDHDVESALVLITASPNVNFHGWERGMVGKTPLTLAAERGCFILLSALIDHGADVELTSLDTYGRKPLHYAAQLGWRDCARHLLYKGAQIESTTNRGRTSLHLAAESGHADLVNLLLRRGAQPMTLSANGYTAAYFACFRHHDEVAMAILGHMTDEQALTTRNRLNQPLLWAAAANDCVEVTGHLINIMTKTGASARSLLSEKVDGRSVGYEAVAKGAAEVAKVLLEHQASFEGNDKEGNGVVHQIAIHGRDDILTELLLHQPEVIAQTKVQNANKHLPLHLAAMNRHIGVLKILLRLEAPDWPLDSINTNGWTALHWVAYYNKLELARLITNPELETDTSILDDSGLSAFQIAEQYHPDSIELLECVSLPEVHPGRVKYPAVDPKRPVPPKGAEGICRHIPAGILDIYDDHVIQARRSSSIYDLIYQYGPRRIMSAIKNARRIEGKLKCRWIHLAANNVSSFSPFDLVEKTKSRYLNIFWNCDYS